MAIPPSVSLSAPYTLFPLAPSLSTTTTLKKGHHGCLTSLVETPSTKKRKRNVPEIVTAVDGEGVNVYDVSSTQILSSFATPTSTQFSCAPSCIRTQTSSRTYAAVAYPKKKILCWAQAKKSDGTANSGEQEGISNFSRVNDTHSDIVFLKSLVRSKKEVDKSTDTNTLDGDVLAVFADSQVKCFSADLASENWSYKPEKGKIVFATTTTAVIARQTILKNRPDVMLWDDGNSKELVLLTISANGSISLHSILTSSKSLPARKPVHHLLTIPVPALASSSTNPPEFAIHFATGTLHCLVDEKLMTYSLLTTTPSMQSIIPLRGSTDAGSTDGRLSRYSLVCISSTMVLVSTPLELSLYETKYSSLQATMNLSPDDVSVTMDIHLSVFIDEINLAVGHSADGIVAIQLARLEKTSRSSRNTGLLINSICRGVEDLSVVDKTKNASQKKKLIGRRKDVNEIQNFLKAEKKEQKLVLQNLLRHRENLDVEGFEDEFAKYVWVQRDSEQQNIYAQWKKSQKEPITNGAPPEEQSKETSVAPQNLPNTPEPPEFLTPQSRRWQKIKESNPSINYRQMEENFHWRPLAEQFITSVLSMIFELKPDGTSLEIGFFPTNVIKYLVESGSFSPELLRTAERQQNEERPKINKLSSTSISGLTHMGTREIGQGGLVWCLVEYDPSLTHLAWFLRETGDMDIGELIAAIKVVLGRINGSQQAFLSNPSTEEDDETRLQRLTHEAEIALERASQALEDTVVLEEVLRLSMRRLNAFPSEAVVRGFKTGLEGDELMSLIRILRREMVIDRVGDDSEQLHDEEAILGEQGTFEAADVELICEILTCALDAVGVAGLILANDTVVGHQSSAMNIGIDGEQLELDGDDDEDDGDDDTLFDSQEGNQLLISSLHSEITHTVTALQESAALSGLITELIRHAGGLEAIKAQDAAEKQRKSKASVAATAATKQSSFIQSQQQKKAPTETQKSLSTTKPKPKNTTTILQLPIQDKYLRNRRIQRRSHIFLSSPFSHHHLTDQKLKAKLHKAGLPIPASLLREEEIRQQRKLLLVKAQKGNAHTQPYGGSGNASGSGNSRLGERGQQKQKMLPLGLPPPALVRGAGGVGLVGLGAVWEKADSAGEVRVKSAKTVAEEGSKLVGMYSLEKWVV